MLICGGYEGGLGISRIQRLLTLRCCFGGAECHVARDKITAGMHDTTVLIMCYVAVNVYNSITILNKIGPNRTAL